MRHPTARSFPVVLLLFSALASANTNSGPVPAAPHTVGPETVVRAGLDALRLFVTQGRRSSAEAAAFLNEQIAPSFDFEYMTDYALGRLAGHLKTEHRESLQDQIRRHFLTTLARTLTNAGGRMPEFVVRATRARGQHEAVVHTQVSLVNGPSMPVSFRFYYGEKGWRIFDVVALNSSALMYYRQMLRRLLNP